MKLQYLSILMLFMTLVPAFGQPVIEELDWPVEIVYHDSGFAEGAAIAEDGRVYFSDMDKSVIFVYNPESKKTKVWQDNSRCSNGLFISDNHLYACEATGRAVVRYNLDKGPESREIIIDKYQGKKLGSPNDLTIINNQLFFSSFWLGNRLRPIKAEREIFTNRVYQVSLDNRSIDSVPYIIKLPNGVAKSPNGKYLYMANMREHKILQAEVEKDKIKNIKVFSDLSFMGKAGPDGMAVSKNGTLFVALFGANKIMVIDKNGSPKGYLSTGRKTTNCTLSSDETTLYITSDGKLKKVMVPEGH